MDPGLDPAQQRAWLAFIRVQLRLTYEMTRQLQLDSGMSLPDWDVLTALGAGPAEGMAVTALTAQIGWERSRLSHHARRMADRGLVASPRSRRALLQVPAQRHLGRRPAVRPRTPAR
jgi:DNA-binding MarR family transcriptional regulator